MTFPDLPTHLREEILSTQNADGGWGYARGRASRLEPTAWALLALSAPPVITEAQHLERGVARVGVWQTDRGLLADVPSPANLAFNGLALVVLERLRMTAAGAAMIVSRLLPALLDVRGSRGRPEQYQRQDNRLQGWPWTDGAFSWVEPTAWCLLALKRTTNDRQHATIAARADEAEKLLRDRACAGGGWNYGNSNMLGQELRAYVPTTATVLLALQDRGHGPTTRAALGYLERAWGRERSGHALSLALMALLAHGRPGSELAGALADAFKRTAFLGNLAVTAMAAYATALHLHSDATTLQVL